MSRSMWSKSSDQGGKNQMSWPNYIWYGTFCLMTASALANRFQGAA